MRNRERFLWLAVESALMIILVRWLVNGSWWLDVFLAGAMANAAELYRREYRNRRAFNIADAELVRVSALANGLDREVSDLRSQIEELQSRL